MIRHIDLPRGSGDPSEDSALATGRWATPDEIAEYAYQRGAFYLGNAPVPSAEAALEIEQLRTQQQEIAADTQRCSDMRAVEIDEIEAEIQELALTDKLEIGLIDDRHQAIFGATRAGKTRTVLIPNLKRYPGSMFTTDPKAELMKATLEHRRKPKNEGGLGQTCHVMDPYGLSKLPLEERSSFNPLDLIDEEDDLAVDVASNIADTLVVRTNAENEHFDHMARFFIQSIILYVAFAHQKKATRNLIAVHDYLMRGAVLELQKDRAGPAQPDDPSPFDYLLGLMRRCEAFDGAVAAGAESLLSMGDRERGSVLSTARRSVEFLSRRSMRRMFASSSFHLDSLKADPNGVSLYICMSPHRMHDGGRFPRLMIGLLIERIYEVEEPPATGQPVLAMLEEFPVLGHMTVIEQAAGYAASFGLKLLIVAQDLNQIKRHYPQGWETIIGNAGCVQAFGNNDQTTLDYLSKRIGECVVRQTNHNLSKATASTTNDPSVQAQFQGMLGARGDAGIMMGPLGLLVDQTAIGSSASLTESWTSQYVRTPMMLPDELNRFLSREENNQVVLISGKFPILMQRST